MNSIHELNLVVSLAVAINKVNDTRKKLEACAETLDHKKAKGEIITLARDALTTAQSPLELISLEILLQTYDLSQAQTDDDRNSIKSAQHGYEQILELVEQMDRSPEEFLASNRIAKDFKSPDKLPFSRGPDRIQANRVRMRNRASFSSEDDRQVWDVRIAVADKTESLLDALTATIAAKILPA